MRREEFENALVASVRAPVALVLASVSGLVVDDQSVSSKRGGALEVSSTPSQT